MKTLRVFFAVLLTVVTLTHSKPSQAAVGALVAVSAVSTAGLVIAGGGGALTTVGFFGEPLGLCHNDGCLAMLAPIILGAIAMGIGLVVLDGEQQIVFQEVDSSAAKKLGLTEEERQSFNTELDEANMLLSDVNAQVAELRNPTSRDSARIWNVMKDLVSPATFSAMVKIAGQKQ